MELMSTSAISNIHAYRDNIANNLTHKEQGLFDSGEINEFFNA
jgi:hypothetical protein